jgi:REase_DpnII-MboI/AbiJ N-terminal domain 3
MELIPVALRHNFRELCSTIVLRQIDDLFLSCGLQRKEVSPETLSRISGERRHRVEEYYASLDWTNPADAQKFLHVVSFALVQEYVPMDYKERLRQMYSAAGFQVNGNTIALPAHELQTVSSNAASGDAEERNITDVTRRDIIDKLSSLAIEGRLDLLDFLKMTWPNLDSMPSPISRASLEDDISRHMISFPDWEYDYLLYRCFKLGECSDELFTDFLASCIHPLVRPDKKEVAELLSFFNEALQPDGYVLKPVSMQSGRPIYKAFRFRTKDEEYIVPRAIEIIEQLARNFHSVVRKLSQRHDNRPPLEIRDEYDVQDLFYALLTPFFEDIRPEEVAPSHAGGHGRIDFLIKAEQIVIEIKKTRPSLKVKELRDQLIVDKELYRTHPHCRTFIAFIYDPDGYIGNAIGFERDLSNAPGDIRVKVIVAPR